jgi:hypothetical protein
MKGITRTAFFLVCVVLLAGIGISASAQEAIGVSVGYEYIPHVNFADPEPGFEAVEIQLNTWSIGAAFPLSFGEGSTLLLNSVNYQRLGFNYKGWQSWMGERPIQAHSISYSAFLLQTLTERWTLVISMVPGIASELDGELSTYDFTLSAIVGAMRAFGEKNNFTLGAGLAYTWDFGDPIPLPFLYVDWNISSKLNISGILPANLAITYMLFSFIDVGLLASIGGNRYHGDPDKFGVDNPQMKYSLATVGPKVQIHFTKWLHLNLEGGYTIFRNFSFWDGPTEVSNFDMENTFYLRASTVIGM